MPDPVPQEQGAHCGVVMLALIENRNRRRIGNTVTASTAPAWLGAELTAWRPDELAVLRGNVCGGQESIVRALRAVHEYRLSVDRLPPLAGQGGK